MASLEHTVEFHEFGGPAAEAVRAAVARLKREDPLAPVTVAAPGNYASLQLRRIIGTTAVAVNVRFIRLPRLAELIGAPALEAEGKPPLTDAARIECARQSIAGPAGRNANWESSPAMLAAVERLYAELGDCAEEDLNRLAAGEAGRWVESYRVFRELTAGFYDTEMAARAAAAAVRGGSSALEDVGHVIVYLPRSLTPGQKSLMEALAARNRLTVIAGDAGEVDANRATRQMLGLPADTATPVTGFESAGRTAVPERAGRIVIAPDAEQEVRAALRAICERMAAGTPLFRMALLYRQEKSYALLSHEQLNGAGIPFNGVSPRTIAQTIAGRFLLGLFGACEEGFSRRSLFEWLSSAPVRDPSSKRRAPTSAWERLSRDAGVVDGGGWNERLNAASARRARQAEERQEEVSEGFARRLAREREAISSLQWFVAQLKRDTESQERITWSALAERAGALLQKYLGTPDQFLHGLSPEAQESEEDGHRKVEQALEELAALDTLQGPSPTVPVFQEMLARLLDMPARRAGGFGHGIFVGRLADAVGMEFDAIFVLGASDAGLPPRPSDDPLIPDRLRRAAGGSIPLRAESADGERRDYLGALASAPAEHRTLFCPQSSRRDGSRLFPSEWLLESARALAGQPISAEDLAKPAAHWPWLERVASFEAAVRNTSHPGSLQEYDLKTLLAGRAAGRALGEHPLAVESPVFAAALRCDAARRSPLFSQWDGLLAADGFSTGLAPGTDRPVAATSLEMYARCPFRWFLSHGLKVAETRKPEESLTIAATDRGTVMHRILERLWIEAVLPAAPEWPPDAEAQMERIAGEELTSAEASGLTGRSLLWAGERRRIMGLLHSFLRTEASRRQTYSLQPLLAEFEFDSQTVAFDGVELLIRGKVDRVDRDAHGSLMVMDYKSGSAIAAQNPADPTDGGRMLQPAVYAEAIRQKLEPGAPNAPRFFYINLAEAGKKAETEYALDPTVTGEVLTILRDSMEAGVFPANSGKKDHKGFKNCGYCPYDRVCSADRDRAWVRKQATPAAAGYVSLGQGAIAAGDADDAK